MGIQKYFFYKRYVNTCSAENRKKKYFPFEELGINSDKCDVLITEPASNIKQNREKRCQIIFEEFNVNGYYTTPGPIFALYASGSMSIGDSILIDFVRK